MNSGCVLISGNKSLLSPIAPTSGAYDGWDVPSRQGVAAHVFSWACRFPFFLVVSIIWGLIRGTGHSFTLLASFLSVLGQGKC